MRHTERWSEQTQLLFERLNEQQRRLVAGLLSKLIGWGGDTVLAQATGLDPKTIKRGREELDNDLKDCPADRVRREGAGRPCAEKKIRSSKAA